MLERMIGQARVQMRRREASGGEATAGEERFTASLLRIQTGHPRLAAPITQPPRTKAGRFKGSGVGSEAVADAGGDQVDLEVLAAVAQVVALELEAHHHLIDHILGPHAIEGVDIIRALPVLNQGLTIGAANYINVSIPGDQAQLAEDAEARIDGQPSYQGKAKAVSAGFSVYRTCSPFTYDRHISCKVAEIDIAGFHGEVGVELVAGKQLERRVLVISVEPLTTEFIEPVVFQLGLAEGGTQVETLVRHAGVALGEGGGGDQGGQGGGGDQTLHHALHCMVGQALPAGLGKRPKPSTLM